jgi:hypothetical protein
MFPHDGIRINLVYAHLDEPKIFLNSFLFSHKHHFMGLREAGPTDAKNHQCGNAT